ncbi:MAG: hypothetical protein CMH05_03470 [Marinovum sp.]|nr:hypothetical protein [Marinovum sp.]|tara:strand:+ start:6619 stop:10452 length:3834 start_codon:yes stop_codon:yes gene_type:complete
MAYQRTTKAQGFRQRVVPNTETKQYTDLAKSLEKERKSTVTDYKLAANEQIAEMKRLDGLQTKEDTYELQNLREFSKTLNKALDTAAQNILKPMAEGQIEKGISAAIRCQQGDEEGCAAVKLNDDQEFQIQTKIADQRTKVNEATDDIKKEWDEAGFEAELRQEYRLLNLKKQNANFATGYRRGMLMEAATGYDAWRDSILTGNSDDPLVEREVEHNGETYKVSEYYSIKNTDVKEKIVGALQGEYVKQNGVGLNEYMVNKYLTNKVVERTNIFNQNEFKSAQRDWASEQIDYYKDQFETFTFSDLDSENGINTAELGVQEFLNNAPGIMEALGVEGSRYTASKTKLIEILTDTLTSEKFKNIDDSEDLLSFLEEDRFYIAGVSPKKKDGTYEKSSLSDLFGSDLDTNALRAEVLESISSEARKTLTGKKIQLNEELDSVFTRNGDDIVTRQIELAEVYQKDEYYGKYWANAIFKQRDSSFIVTPPLNEVESRKLMKELEKQYDVKNGGKINIFNVNVQRIDSNVLKEYKDNDLFGDPYDGDEGAKKLHEGGVLNLQSVVKDIFKERELPEGEKKLQSAAFINWVSPRILTTARKYAELNNVDISDGIQYAVNYYTQKLKAENSFGGLVPDNKPIPAIEDAGDISLLIDENGFSDDIYKSITNDMVSVDKQSELHLDILQKANDAVANNNGYIFKKNSIVKAPVFFILTDEGRPGIIFEALSRIDPLSTHPAVIYNDQVVKNGGKPEEWNDQIKAEIAEWEGLTADTRKALTSNVDVRVNTALKQEGYISLTDLTQTLITPDGSIPVREDEYSALLVAAGVTDTFTYDQFLARPDLVERVIKQKMFNGLKLIEGTTNNNNETIRKLTAYMVTGDTENWNKGDFSNYSLEALNAYHSGSNERLNSLFNNNGISLNSFNLDVPFSRDLIDTEIDNVLNVDLTTVTSLEDLETTLTKFNELDVPEQKINIREYSTYEQGAGLASHQLRRILGKGWERVPNPEYARYIKFKSDLEEKIYVSNVLENGVGFMWGNLDDGSIQAEYMSRYSSPQKNFDHVFLPAVENIIGKERLDTIKEKGSSTDGIFELLKLEPEFAGITIEPSAASEITDTDINNERRLELEIEMLDIIHSGESTVDVTGNGYEAFNQGGSNEGKTVEGFSGTYGDHQANTGKKLTEMTIKDILANQDSGYNTKLYPFTKEGTEKWHKSGGIHAAGRYQFTRVGLREALKRSDLKETDLFSEINQDKLAMILLTQIGSSQWTSMAGNEKLEELLKKYKSIK